jgi:hypothetical protein
MSKKPWSMVKIAIQTAVGGQWSAVSGQNANNSIVDGWSNSLPKPQSPPIPLSPKIKIV